MYYIQTLDDAAHIPARTVSLHIQTKDSSQCGELPQIWQLIRSRVGPQLEFLQISSDSEPLPDFLGDFPKLTKLKIAALSLPCLPASLSKLSKLLFVSILTEAALPAGETLPSLAASAQSLLDLTINIPDIGALPAWLQLCTQLYSLEWLASKSEQLPDVFACWKKLQIFSFDGASLRHLPPSLFALPNLSSLSLCKNQLESLPAALWNLSKLTQLALSDNAIRRLGEGLSEHTAQNSLLQNLQASNNPIEWLSPHLWNLGALDTLLIDPADSKKHPSPIGWWLHEVDLRVPQAADIKEGMRKLSITVAGRSRIEHFFAKFVHTNPTSSIQTVIYAKLPLSHAYWSEAARAVWAGIDKSWSHEERNEILHFLALTKKGKTSPLPLAALLRAYTIRTDDTLRPILDTALQAACEDQLAANPLSPQSRLLILGDFFAPVEDLLQQWQPYFDRVGSDSQRAGYTHLLLSMNAKRADIDTVLERLPHIVPLSWQQVLAYLRERGHFQLLQATEQEVQNLEMLLLSPDENNVRLALTLLASSGLPAPLLEAVGAVIARQHPNPEAFKAIRQQARMLVSAFFSPQWAQEIWELITTHYNASEWTKLQKACKSKRLDFGRVCRALDAIGAKYIEVYWQALRRQSKEALQEVLRQYLQKHQGILTLEQVKYAGNVLQGMPELIGIDCSEEWFSKYPDPFAFQFPQIRQLNLARCGLTQLGKPTLHLRQLELLDLSEARYLQEFPPLLAKLPNLRKIRCGGSLFGQRLYEKQQKNLPISKKDIDIAIFDISQLPDTIIRRR